MRVLFVSHGESSQAHERMAVLARDVELAVVAPRVWKHPLRPMEFSTLNTERFDAYPLDVWFNGDIYRYVYRGLAGVIRRVRPDVIHIEDEPCAWSTFQTLLLRRLLRPSARVVGFTWENLIQTGVSPLRRGIETYALRRLDFLICGNRGAQEVVRAKGYRGPTDVFPQWGVSLEVYRRVPCEALKERLRLQPPVIGYVGRLVESKGLITLLRSAAALGPRPATLLLVGSGPLRDRLSILWEELGAPFPLVVTDSVPHADVPEYLSAMDLFVLPSETAPNWKEQFGHVLIEAMAVGVPVIGSDSGEIPNVIGDAGLVFPEGNADALARCLRDALESEEKRSELGRAGYARAASEYELSRVTRRNLEIYRRLAGGAAPLPRTASSGMGG